PCPRADGVERRAVAHLRALRVAGSPAPERRCRLAAGPIRAASALRRGTAPPLLARGGGHLARFPQLDGAGGAARAPPRPCAALRKPPGPRRGPRLHRGFPRNSSAAPALPALLRPRPRRSPLRPERGHPPP